VSRPRPRRGCGRLAVSSGGGWFARVSSAEQFDAETPSPRDRDIRLHEYLCLLTAENARSSAMRLHTARRTDVLRIQALFSGHTAATRASRAGVLDLTGACKDLAAHRAGGGSRQLIASGCFPFLVAVRAAGAARPVARGDRSSFVGEEHAVSRVAAAGDGAQRSRTVEATVRSRCRGERPTVPCWGTDRACGRRQAAV